MTQSPQRRAARGGFTFVEMCVVAAILAVFATLVIPRIASARGSAADSVEQLLEADLRRARTEALARATPIVVVAAHDGSSWWIAEDAQPSTPLTGTQRAFGRGTLVEHGDARLDATLPNSVSEESNASQPRIFARFDALGSRDEGIPTLTLTESARRSAQWTLPAGRSRLEK
jgi:prepilin-type N-terminal cleavage/methylation domain-containing protein